MPDYGVIADVSATLQSVLTDALSVLGPGPPVAEVHNLQTTPSTNPARITIFLYEVVEDPTARNRPRVQGSVPPDVTVQKPPMALILRYLLTPWGGDRVTEQKMLGRAMQVLYDGSIISGPQLKGDTLKDTDQAIKITLQLLTLEDRARVFYSVQQKYGLSVNYEARLVNLDPISVKRIRQVRDRTLDFAKPESIP